MANQMERIVAGLRAETSTEAANEILDGCGVMPLDAEQREQGRWIRRLIQEMDGALSGVVCARIMEGCGRQCIPDHVIAEAVRACGQSEDIDRFLAKMNDQQINGGNLRREGNTIQVRYGECYCGIVSKVGEQISQTYCNCSVGWNRAFFEAVFGKPVEVRLVESVVSGASGCLLEVVF